VARETGTPNPGAKFSALCLLCSLCTTTTEEAQRGWVTCPRSQTRSQITNQDLTHSSLLCANAYSWRQSKAKT
jgi:hypothetical protein